MTTGVLCTVYVDGLRAADGSPGDDLTNPVILEDLAVSWGRSDTMSQPDPDTCTFEVIDSAGGTAFGDIYRVGRRVDVVATGDTYPDPTIPTFINPGFETAEVTWSATAATATRSTLRAHTGTYSLAVKPTSAAGGSVLLAPAPFSAPGTDPDAWDEIPTTSVGQSWSSSVALRAPVGASVTIHPVRFSGPYQTAATVLPPVRVVDGTGAWEVVDYEATTQVNGAWLGVQIVVSPTGPAWDEMPPTLTWNGVDPALTWDELGTVFVDDVTVRAPGSGTGRGVLVFSGRVTDLSAAWDDTVGGPIVKVTALGFTADLENRTIGSEPWSVESVDERAHRILDLAGLPIEINIADTLDVILLSYRDVDAQGATGLLKEIATSVDGVLWPAVHQTVGAYLDLEDPSQRASLLQLTRVDGPPAEVLNTNLVTNPDAETAGALAVFRTNLATTPDGRTIITNNGTTIGWSSSRWFGGGSATGTYTPVTGAVDGPPGTGITAYLRKAWTNVTGGAQGDTGINTNSWTGFVAGAVYTVSGWMRSSVNRTNTGFDVEWRDATGVFQRLNLTTGTLAAGVWQRFSTVVTAPPTGATLGTFILDTDAGTAWVVGSTLDVTGLLVEQIGTVGAVQRTNLHTNPVVGRATTNWSTQAGGGTFTATRETSMSGTTSLPPTATPTWFKMTSTVANTVADVGINATPISTGTAGKPSVTAGLTYTLSGYFVASVTPQVRLIWGWFDSAGNLIGSFSSGTLSSITANAWVRVSSGAVVAPAGAAYVAVGYRTVATVGQFAPGTYLGGTAVLVEQTATLGAYFDGSTVGTTVEYGWTGAPYGTTSVARTLPSSVVAAYFDGSTPAVGDFTFAWSGTAYASTSVQRAPGLVGVTRYGLPVAWTATTEHDHGSRSWAVQPTSTTTPQGLIWTVPNVPTGQTISALLRVKAPAGLPLQLTGRTSTGGSTAPPVLFTGTGSWETITFATTAVAGTTLVGVQLHTRAPYQPVPFYADLALVVVAPEAYTGPYFDGATPDTKVRDYAWTGAAHASSSTESTVQTHTIVIVRKDPDTGFDLSACQILRDPVTWTQTVADVVTRVAVGWLVQGVDEEGLPTTTDATVEVVDAGLEASYGTRRVQVSTQLQDDEDAYSVAGRVLARTSATDWRADGLTLDDDEIPAGPEGVALLLDLLDGTSRIGAPIVLGDLPAWTPTGVSAGVYLEGGTYRFVGGRWVLDLLVSSSTGLGQSAAWDELDPVWTWDQWDPAITWNDLRGVAAP